MIANMPSLRSGNSFLFILHESEKILAEMEDRTYRVNLNLTQKLCQGRAGKVLVATRG